MFNITRPQEVPKSLAKKQYNHTDVIDVLKEIFHDKCYLCERNNIQDVEVEHLDPHKSDETKKYDWHNLFYSCSRCNSLKGTKHINLLDCTDSSVNVFREIIIEVPSASDRAIIVKASSPNPSEQILNTVALLQECYNSINTAQRLTSRKELIKQIDEYQIAFLSSKLLLTKPSTGKSARNGAKEVIEAMLDISHPFSAIWRWQYLHDNFLRSKYPELENTFDDI